MFYKTAIALVSVTLGFTALHAQTGSSAAQSLQAAAPAPLLESTAPATSTQINRIEDWTTLSLAKSGLPINSTGGVLLSKTEHLECTRELLRLQWRPHDPIDLYVILPRGIERPPVALYLLDYTFDSNVFRGDGWCKQANQNGLAIVGFVSALSGQRFHSPRPMNEWFVSELQEALSTSTHDVQMVLNYLETRRDLDLKRVGMFGEGSGASVAILATATDPRIAALDVIGPWGDWPDWLKDSRQIPDEERAAYLKLQFLQRVVNLDPMANLPQLQGRVIRIQQVMDDPITPPVARDKIAGVAPKLTNVVRYRDIMAQEKAWGANGLSGWLGGQLHSQKSK